MEENKLHKDIELKSEEVQEVMNHIPPTILRYGISGLLGILLILIIGSTFFNYPDTINTEFTLSTKVPPAYIITKTEGRIEQLYVTNRQSIHEKDIIGVIQNTAITEDILYLREKMNEWKVRGSQIEQTDMLFFRRIPELGDTQYAYSSCLLAWNNYLQHMQENRIYETELLNAIASLQVALTEWGENYLLESPINGTVAFMQPWENNQTVESGKNMFVIIPENATKPLGIALLPMDGIGKVKIGQRALIRFPAFPEQEFGFIEGTVISISPVPDQEGYYVLEISLPQNLETNYGKEFPPIKTIKGIASIIIEEKKLFERLLNIEL